MEKKTPMSDMINTVITERVDSLKDSTIAQTPADEPYIVIHPLPWYRIVAVRSGRVYVQSLISFLTIAPAAVAAGVLPREFAISLQNAALLAVGPAVLSILQNTAELLARLDESHPKLRA
jgi:hypothetical protein